MQVFNYDSDFDLELFEKKKKEKIENHEQFRLEPYKSGGREYWRFASASRGNKKIIYIGNRQKMVSLYGSKFAQRKPRNRIV